MSAPPIYGVAKFKCTAVEAPESNKAVLEYIKRMNNIMKQLYLNKEKAVTLERIDILISEVKAKLVTINIK